MNQTEAEQQSTGDSQAVAFGASLREIRLAHQRELTDVADDLRIRQVFLQAIEDGRFDELPGPAYAVGFVRGYADYLGLDVEAVVSQFKALRGGFGRQAHLVPPSPVSEGRLPTGSVLLVAAVLAAGAYGGWYYLSLDGRAGMDGVAALPQRIAALVGMRSESEAPQPAAASAKIPKPEEPAAAADDKTAAPGPAEQVNQGSADPADSSTQQNQGDGGLTQPQTPPAAEPIESTAAPETTMPETSATASAPDNVVAPEAPVQETPAAASAAAPPPAPELIPAPGAAPAVTAEPAPAPARAPAPVSEPPPAAESAIPAAVAPIAAMAPASGAGVETATPETTPPATAQTASVPPETAFGPQARITVRATTNSWVEVIEKNGKTVFSRMMQAGEAVDLPIGPGMTLNTGNAGGIEILLGDEVLPPLGPKGEVRRNVALEAESLRQNSGGAR